MLVVSLVVSSCCALAFFVSFFHDENGATRSGVRARDTLRKPAVVESRKRFPMVGVVTRDLSEHNN